MTKIEVRFMTLSGPFELVRKEVYTSTSEIPAIRMAYQAVLRYALENGYSNVKRIDDEDDPYIFSCRFTGRTPGGRPGRNIAFAEDIGMYGEKG